MNPEELISDLYNRLPVGQQDRGNNGRGIHLAYVYDDTDIYDEKPGLWLIYCDGELQERFDDWPEFRSAVIDIASDLKSGVMPT